MYLVKKTDVKNWGFRDEEKEGLFKVVVKRGNKKIEGVKEERIAQIVEDVMYWRKANAIHIWFVKNVQEGEDDCKEYYVDHEKLKELRDIIRKVLKKHSLAHELLPTGDGFFFGDTSYNEYYFEDLKKTDKVFTELLKDERHNKNRGEFYYQSSW
jgi:hypothetical protein